MLTLNKKLFVKKQIINHIYKNKNKKYIVNRKKVSNKQKAINNKPVISKNINIERNKSLLKIKKKYTEYTSFLKQFIKKRKRIRRIKTQRLLKNYDSSRKNQVSLTRSMWKGPFSKNRGMILPYIKLLRRYNKDAKYTFLQYTTNKHFASIFSNITTKASIIMPQYIGMEHYVYMGERYRDIRVRSDHIGYRFGEFDNTTKRSYLIHRINKKSKTKKKQKK